MTIVHSIEVVIVDDQVLFAEGLKQLIQSQQGIVVTGLFHTARGLEEKLSKMKCDVLLLDINIPHRDGIMLCKQLKAIYPEIKIAILSMYDDDSNIEKAKTANADAFLSKYQSIEEIVYSIRRVAKKEGECFFVNKENSNRVKVYQVQEANFFELKQKLTQREIEIVDFIVGGKEPKEVAEALFISYETFKTHRSSIFKKLQIRNEVELTRLVLGK